MIAKIINGSFVAKKIISNIAKKIRFCSQLGMRSPCLSVILIGNEISSSIYVNMKKKICKDLGIIFILYHLSKKICTNKLLRIIYQLNKNKTVDGILIQLPLPFQLYTLNILNSILPHKDVDGFHSYNFGRLCQFFPFFRPCVSKGIIRLLKFYHIKTIGLNAVIIGASNTVGKPIFLELLSAGCTVTITHKFTNNLKSYVKRSDLLVVAVGKAFFIPGNWIKPGAIVIDVGINRLNNGKIVGDVDFCRAYKYASYITPVPGGVGPMTIASLMKNIFLSYFIYHKYLSSFKWKRKLFNYYSFYDIL